MTAPNEFFIKPGGTLRGKIPIPGDKSISHRALILGAMATGETRIDNFLESADCLATLEAVRLLGIEIEQRMQLCVTIRSRGLLHLQPPPQILDCGNSGTSARLLMGLLAGLPFESVLTGDASLRRRPMQRVIGPLLRMGAKIDSPSGLLPLKIHGRRPLMPLRYDLPVASAQVKSCLLLAGLQASGETWLKEPAMTRDHTERMLALFGCELLNKNGWLGIRGGQQPRAAAVHVPGDLSSAAFFIVAAAVQPRAHIELECIGVNPGRDGVLKVLKAMGADIHLKNQRVLGNEPVADIEVRGGTLQAVDIGPEMVPLAIDELPVLMIAAACARGVSVLRGAAELRHKESDRLQTMTAGLVKLGVAVEPREDGMRITGGGGFKGGVVDSFGDHRIAMAFSMAAVLADSPLQIRDCRNVDTSFPDFAKLARAAGLPIEVRESAGA
ncbi:MAG: 3-phosphoshikimate 1-carboxyvinyltransferase [Gammaproteobacteria bacterium]|nr:3-phosphoshikimate 1-carboxyvinyltransferase [Gammaproteobacteria bacterium]